MPLSDIYWFNPAVEAHIGFFPEIYQPPQGVVQLTRDLQTIPMLLASADDIVLLSEPPPKPHLERLRQLGVSVPNWRCVRSPKNARGSLAYWSNPMRLQGERLGALKPWGWGPDALYALSGVIRPAHGGDISLPPPWTDEHQHLPWHPGLRTLSSKAQSAQWAHEIAASGPRAPWIDDTPDVLGRPFTEAHDAEAALADVLERWPRAVVKGAFGSSGRDMIRVDARELREHAEVRGRWLDRVLRRHGAVVVEPWLSKVIDVGVQIEIQGDGSVRVIGLGRFLTDIRGQYQGALLGDPTSGLPYEVATWWHAHDVPSALIHHARLVGEKLSAAGHRGPAGIDGLVHRGALGRLRLRPLVEINARFTMGRVALALEKHLEPGVDGVWLHLNDRSVQKRGFDGLLDLVRWLEAEHPAQMNDGLAHGAVLTTPVGPETHTVTVMLAGDSGPEVARRVGIEPGVLVTG
ncbi:MAG: hypothetical protein ACE366_23275 [Bradymonadia bacterium]